jgi:hypothetical protein
VATGNDLLSLAQTRIGQRYVFGTLVPKDNPRWQGPWDCAEFVSWCVYQVAGKLYGCEDQDRGPAPSADAFTGAWRDDSRRLGIVVSVERAARIPGAAVLRYPQPGAIGHIVLSDGNGGTVEAMGSASGVCKGSLEGRRWDVGVLIPGIEYTPSPPGPAPAPPVHVLKLGDAGDDVRDLQERLIAHDYSPGEVDGVFGPHTQAAVVAFQVERGLVPDGEVGPLTWAALRAG